MTRPRNGKWGIDGSPADAAADVAVRALRNRLNALRHCLARAAERPDAAGEHVHQLRVAARRAAAALHLYRKQFPRQRRAWLKRQLKRVRHAADEARDCDVLAARLAAEAVGAARWRADVLAERGTAQAAVAAVHRRLTRGGRFARRIKRLLSRVRTRRHTRFADVARQALRRSFVRFFAAAPSAPADAAALHRFRVRVKQLRYEIELLATAFPQSLRTEVYPLLGALQYRLGEANDLAVAEGRLRERVRRAEHPDVAEAKLLACLRAELDRVRRRLFAELDPRTVHGLRVRFAAALGGAIGS